MGGLFGGKKESAPTQQTITQTNIPDYARPYVEDMLGRSQALTTQNSYQPYSGQRVAGPSGLQQQSYNAARGLAPSGLVSNAGITAGQVANDATRASQYNPGSFGYDAVGTPMWGAGAANHYMNPYMQGVVDIQKREAARQSDIQGTRDGAAAVGAGAFGGSRHAIVEAERQRNLAQLQNDIQAQGANSAWNQAQQMFTSDMGRSLQGQMANQGADIQTQQLGEQSRQFGAGLGLQGLQTKLAAGQLQLGAGNEWMNQKMGITALQNQLGTQQQATEQMKLDAAYQDYENSRLWPYKQLEFMNSMVRGNYAPGQTTSMYQQPPSFASQMAGLGIAGMGMKQMGMFADGGEVIDVDAVEIDDEPSGGIAELLISQIN